MTGNPLVQLHALGQSVWIDYIRRAALEDGTIARLVEQDALTGMTSNPAIFEQALARGTEYRELIERLRARGANARSIYETLTFADVCEAADLLRPVYDGSDGRDGYVSIEVSPHLADDVEATCTEATRLWQTLNRANVMIKIPATRAGVVALRRLVATGVNVNATLLFSVSRYREIAAAYIDAVADAARHGRPPSACASVASFFLSRIDSHVDRQLDRLGTAGASALRGQAAIACARLAYQAFCEVCTDPRWQELAARGARPQRLLWASTSTKDPTYPDIKYVEPLIAPDTINTMPPETLAAYRDHGRPARRIDDEADAARALPARLAELGIELETVATDLEREGLRKFVEPYDRSLRALTTEPSPTPA